MTTLRIYLGNTHKMKFKSFHVEDATWFLFNKSVQLSNRDKFSSVLVKMVDQRPSLQPTDLLIYLLPNRAAGILGARFGNYETRDDQFGRTSWEGKEFGAEVYVLHLADQPWDIAKFVWHEALHVKTKEGSKMHKRGGLAGDIEIGAKGLGLTEQNIKAMAEFMDKKRPMWTGGFDVKIKGGPITLD